MDFAPSDPTDGRRKYQWQTRYPDRAARRRQLGEGLYLGGLIVLAPVVFFLLWARHLQDWLGLDPGQSDTFRTYGLAWMSGLLGGAVFATKWLYHTVAHGYWNADRFLWRLFTPHLSAAFAFGLVALVTSGLVNFLDEDVLRAPAAAVGIAFLLGYFSDFTVARLAKTARQMLGASETDRDAKRREADVGAGEIPKSQSTEDEK